MDLVSLYIEPFKVFGILWPMFRHPPRHQTSCFLSIEGDELVSASIALQELDADDWYVESLEVDGFGVLIACQVDQRVCFG